MELKRDEIKYIRDLAKKSYNRDTECRICLSSEDLQFHHFYSLTLLWNKWKKQNKIIINTVDDILEHREVFKEEFNKELYEDTVTLCKHHHMGVLHKIYGKIPPLGTAKKQKRWVEKQRDKHLIKMENK